MFPGVFICYSSQNAEVRDELREHLRQFEGRFVGVVVDIEIRPGLDWRAKIIAAMQEARVAVILVSHHLFASDFVMGTELPELMRRWSAGEIDVIVIEVSAHSAGEHGFGRDERGGLTLTRMQSLHRRPPFDRTLDRITEKADRKAFFEYAVGEVCLHALARERFDALAHLTRAQVIDAWREAQHPARGRPELPFPAEAHAALRVAIEDLRQATGELRLERLQRFGASPAPPSPSAHRAEPDARVVLRRLPDDTEQSWLVDVYGPSSHLESKRYTNEELPTCLLDIAHFTGRPAHDVRIEVVLPLRDQELPVDSWPVREGIPGFALTTPAGRLGRLTLRSLERAEDERMRAAIRRRMASRPSGHEGFGRDEANCTHAKVRVRAGEKMSALGYAQCAVIDHVPERGPGRIDALKVPLIRGIATLLWCRAEGRGEELAALAAPHAPGELSRVVLDARDAGGLGDHLTLVVDDDEYELPLLTSPTEEP